jgi:hypothetical protein
MKRLIIGLVTAIALVLASAPPASATSAGRHCRGHVSPNGQIVVYACADLDQHVITQFVQGRGIWYKTNDNGPNTTITVRNVKLFRDGHVVEKTGNLGTKSVQTSEQSVGTAYTGSPHGSPTAWYSTFYYTINWPQGAQTIAAVSSYVVNS